MAKKTKELSLEEKLEQALVPVDEQPYEVPGNWNQIYLKSVVSLGDGEKISGEEHKYLEVKYLRGNKEPDIKTSGKYVEDGDYVILVDGENSGEIFKLSESGYMGSTFKKLSISNKLDTDYILYFIQQNKEFLRNNKKGSAIPHLNKELFGQLVLSLPPVEEQKRIVKAIECLFSKLDEAKEIAEEIVESAKLRKMSMLHETFSGKLTANWRQKNGVSDESWEEKTLNEVCKSIYDGDHMPPPKSESGIPFLVISNVNKGILSFENTRFVPEEYYENITDTRKPEKGDLLYTLVGSYGIPVMVDDDREFCFQRHMGLLKPNKIDAKFLWYQMQSQEFYDKATGIANGTAQLTVPIKRLRNLKIFCPTKEEQMEIVALLDKIWEKESITEQIVSGVIEDIDALKKSILAKAFRGELGTNIESEESSIELLKRILIES